MRFKLLIYLLLLLLYMPVGTYGQGYVDLMGLNYELSPSNKYKGRSETVDVENTSSFIRIPLLRKNGDAWLPGASVSRVSLLSEIPDLLTPSTYFTIRPEFGYQKNWGDSLNLVAIFLPRISSDFIDLDQRSYQYGGVVILNKKKSADFTWKYGLYVNTEFFGFFTTPLIGCDWKVNPRLRVFGLLPANAYGEYSIHEHYHSGLKFQSVSTSYRMTESVTNDYMHLLTNQLSWYHDIYLSKSIVFNAQIGFTAFRYYRMYQNDDKIDFAVSAFSVGGDRMPVFQGRFEEFGDGLLFQFGLIYRYKLNN